MRKGLKVDFLYPHKGYDLYYIQHGKLELTVYNTHEYSEPQTFAVGPDHIIDIPPYHTYTVKVLEDTALYNYGGEYNLMACLEDLASVKKHAPERIASQEEYLDFLRQHGVYATHVEYHPDEV